MYKDKNKQREANRRASQRRRDQLKSLANAIIPNQESMTNQGMMTRNSDANVIPKRGKDIKCFTDLPPDVQRTINRISQSNEEKVKRTAIAIHYQHLFPDRYYSTGLNL
jgi:hypothetical protein